MMLDKKTVARLDVLKRELYVVDKRNRILLCLKLDPEQVNKYQEGETVFGVVRTPMESQMRCSYPSCPFPERDINPKRHAHVRKFKQVYHTDCWQTIMQKKNRQDNNNVRRTR